MSTAWVDKPNNPVMTAAALGSEDVDAALAAVNFADMTLRVAMSADFATFFSLESDEQPSDPSWLRAHAEP